MPSVTAIANNEHPPQLRHLTDLLNIICVCIVASHLQPSYTLWYMASNFTVYPRPPTPVACPNTVPHHFHACFTCNAIGVLGVVLALA